MKKPILAISAAIVLALGMAYAQTDLPVVKAKAGQTTYVEIAATKSGGTLPSDVKLMWTGDNDFVNQAAKRFQALDEGIPGGWKVFVSSSKFMTEEHNTLYYTYTCNTYGLNIPQGTTAGLYEFHLKVLDLETGLVAHIPLTIEVGL